MLALRNVLGCALLLLAFSAGHAFAVPTVSYFPFNDGDLRVFNNPTDGTLLFENISASSAFSTNVWEDRVTQANGNFVVDALWQRDATGARTILGGNLHPPLAAFSPAVVYPADLVVGGPTTTTGNIMVSGFTAGTFSYSLTVESTDTTKGSFTHCVQLLEDVDINVAVFGEFHYITREWRQSGLGLVAVTPDVIAAPTEVVFLIYANVGGVIFGSKLDDATPYFPINAGDRNFEASDLDVSGVADDYFDTKVGSPTSFRGSTASPFVGTRSDRPPSTDYYYWDGSSQLRWVGSHDVATGNDNWLSPAAILLDKTVYQGQHIVSSGTAFLNATSQSTFTSDVQVLQIGASVDTQAGHFDNCLVIRVSLQAPTGTLVNMSDFTLAANAGIVKQLRYDVSNPSSPTVKRTLLLAYANGGGSPTGPAVVDTTGFFPLTTPLRRIFQVQGGGLDDIEVGASALVNGIPVFPLVTTPFGAATPTATNWYGLGYDRLFFFAKTNHLGARWDFSPNPIPFLMPLAFVGQKVAGSGRILNGVTDVGAFSFTTTVDNINASTTVPAGAFTHLVSLSWTLDLTPTSGTPTHIAETWLMDSGVGNVSKLDTAVTPNILRQLVYLNFGTTHLGSLPVLSGDFDASGVVDRLDAQALLDAYLAGPSAYDLAYDIFPSPAADGVIDANDVAAFIRAWRIAHP